MAPNTQALELLATVFREENFRSEHLAVSYFDHKNCVPKVYSYRELLSLAMSVSAWLKSGSVGILGEKSIYAYAGVLGALHRGSPFVPLNSKQPVARLSRIIRTTGLEQMVVSGGTEALVAELQATFPTVRWLNPTDFQHAALPQPSVDSTEIAYSIFTSGTTGQPMTGPQS